MNIVISGESNYAPLWLIFDDVIINTKNIISIIKKTEQIQQNAMIDIERYDKYYDQPLCIYSIIFKTVSPKDNHIIKFTDEEKRDKIWKTLQEVFSRGVVRE